MGLVFKFWDGPPTTSDVAKQARQNREALFPPEFSVLRNDRNSEIKRNLEVHELLKNWTSSDSLILFLHYTKIDDAPERMPEWNISIRNKGIIVYYSGGGIQPHIVKKIGNASDKAGMRGRVFVHRPSFDESIRLTIEGLTKFVGHIKQVLKNNHDSLDNVVINAHEFGWAGIADHSNYEFSLKILRELLLVYEYEVFLSDVTHGSYWEYLKTAVGNADRWLEISLEGTKDDSVSEAVQNQRQQLKEMWEECESLYSAILNSSIIGNKLTELRNHLLGDTDAKGLVDLIDKVWGHD